MLAVAASRGLSDCHRAVIPIACPSSQLHTPQPSSSRGLNAHGPDHCIGCLERCGARSESHAVPSLRTNLEAFAGRSGTVVLKGYTSVGKIKALGDVEITAMNFRSGGSSEESSGILLEVSEPRLSSDREAARSFIDYEEIAGLLDGIDHIRKANHSVTKLANFEAIYRTKGGVWITVYNAAEGNRVAVQSGRIGGQTATLELEHLDQLRALIVRAKEILDDPQKQKTPTEVATATTQTISPPAAAAAPPASAPTIPTPPKRPKVVKKGGQSSGPQRSPEFERRRDSVL